MEVRRAAAALAALLLVAVGGCSIAGDDGGRERRGPKRPLEGCGPIGYGDVAGRAPSYVGPPLADLRNGEALCAGAWLPATGTPFVPQGLVVDGRTAWVSGYDHGLGTAEYGHNDICRLLKVDLRTGRRLVERSPIQADLAPREPSVCWHAGGLAVDEHGLWVSQRTKVWLLAPDDLSVRSVWHLVEPVRGSFLVLDDQGRLGTGGFHSRRAHPLHWFDIDAILEPGVIDLTPGDAVGSQVLPRASQGALWADLGPGDDRLWVARSTTYCGELWAGPARRYAFLPGAEGLSLAGDRLWALSESTSEPYFSQGGRPVVPQVAGFDVGRLRAWERSTCEF